MLFTGHDVGFTVVWKGKLVERKMLFMKLWLNRGGTLPSPTPVLLLMENVFSVPF